MRRSVFSAEELAPLRDACEEVVDELEALSRGDLHEMGSYVFEVTRQKRTVVKWEKGKLDLVLGVEPLAHLDRRIESFARDPRLMEPMKDLLGCDAVDLYTEKLNLKRARFGGPIVLHQDYPYWVGVSADPARIATAVLFLDDADRENGCLEVAPGSHRAGAQRGKEVEGFGANEIDPPDFDESALVQLEVPAGSVVFLGSLLVHRSAPNLSSQDRRAILYSYQPAGFPHSREYIRIDPDRGLRIRRLERDASGRS